MVPKPYVFVFFIFAWADDSVEVIARTKMKENFFCTFWYPYGFSKWCTNPFWCANPIFKICVGAPMRG